MRLANTRFESGVDKSTYLWRKIESKIAVVLKGVFHKERHFVAQAQLHVVTQATSLAEVDEILEGERECDWFAEVDFDILGFVFNVGVLSQRNRSRADISGAVELDTFFCTFDCH